MTYETLEQFNKTGADNLLVYVNHTWSGFIPLTLFVFFLIIAMGTFFSMKRTTGRGHLPSSFASASFTTLVLAIAGFTLIDGLIDRVTLTIVFIVTVFSVLWLLLSKENVM